MEIKIILLLSTLLIVSNVAWMMLTQKLINKLMSRNYTEYFTARAKPPVTAKGPVIERPETFRSPKEKLEVLPTLLGG